MSKRTWEETIAEVKAWEEVVYRLAYDEDGDIIVVSFSWACEYEYAGNLWVDATYYKTEDAAHKARLAYLLSQNRPLGHEDRVTLIRLLRGEV